MASANERCSFSVEKSEKRKVVIEGRRGNSEPDIIFAEQERSDVNTYTSGNRLQWLLSILAESETPEPETKAIDKVPTILRDIKIHTQCFDPMVVSIGPYHNQEEDEHGNRKFARVENLKASIAKKFIGEETEKLVNFEEVSRKARALYEKSSTKDLSDDQFTRMMFLDGCFVLHFIDCVVSGKAVHKKMKTDQVAFVLRDLFLLENQLPFLVLEELMKFRHSDHDWREHINKFVTKPLQLPILPPENDDNKSAHHLLDLLRKKLIGPEKKKQEFPGDDGKHTFRSVFELRKAGIKCKMIKNGTLRDVSYTHHPLGGDLHLPQLVIDDLTKSILLNLVAYEASPGGPTDYVVASYIVLLDALIDHPEDVKELRSKGILQNFLGSDQQVAELFNELATNLAPSPYEYLEVKSNIEKHYKKKVPKWLNELWRTHFSTPWTIIAFIIAGSIILLTFAQTYFSIFPRAGGGGEGERKAPTASRKIHYNVS